MTGAPAEPMAGKRSLAEVFVVLLRLGATSFGGPAAHIAMMERELVERRRWLSHERFLDMAGAANLIPGPSSSELAVFIGYEVAGGLGLLVAGIAFVTPAALMTASLAYVYVHYGTLPRAAALLAGIAPAMLAIVLQALVGLFPKAVKKSGRLLTIGALAAAASAWSVDALIVLLGAGALSALSAPRAHDTDGATSHLAWLPLGAATAPATASTVGLGALFLAFAKLGAVVFGSGYVLLAFLRSELCVRHHWLTERQLLDAVAAGQVTPGPVFTTATFIGFLLAGPLGALVATVAIFLPGFLLVAAIRPIVSAVRRSALGGAFLDGVNVASLALMAVVSTSLGRAALAGVGVPLGIGIFAVSAAMLLRWKLNPTWPIALGALAGVAFASHR